MPKHGQNASLGPQGGVHGPAGCRGADARLVDFKSF